jgi:hypothetical protein
LHWQAALFVSYVGTEKCVQHGTVTWLASIFGNNRDRENERQIKKEKDSDVKSRVEVARSGAEDSKIDYKKKREGEGGRGIKRQQ